MELESFENEYTKMQFVKGVLLIEYKTKLIIDLEVAKKCVADRLLFSKGKRYPIVADMRNVIRTSKEAKQFLSTNAAIEGISAGGFVAQNHFERLLGSVFLSLYVNFNPTKPPVKIFSSVEEAINWASFYAEI